LRQVYDYKRVNVFGQLSIRNVNKGGTSKTDDDSDSFNNDIYDVNRVRVYT